MYKYYNANPHGNNVQDCVIRSISVAEGKSWDETYEKLSDIAQEEGILLDDVRFVENYLDKRYRRVCHYSKTVGEFLKEYPNFSPLFNVNLKTINEIGVWMKK